MVDSYAVPRSYDACLVALNVTIVNRTPYNTIQKTNGTFIEGSLYVK
jgi:hypothetical protein